MSSNITQTLGGLGAGALFALSGMVLCVAISLDHRLRKLFGKLFI